jgi:uncharacterized membrane protein
LLTALLISTLPGFGLIASLVLFRGQALPDKPILLYGLLAGGAGALALLLLFRAMAVGSMAIVAPISATGVILPVLIALGFVDALASISWAVATTQGLLSLVAVIGALYPAVTVLLAVVLLKERPQFVQGVGVILAFIGVVFISAG